MANGSTLTARKRLFGRKNSVEHDSVNAKQIARQLALDAGFAKCYDVGTVGKVLLQERFALACINLTIMQGMGREIAWKLIRRKS